MNSYDAVPEDSKLPIAVDAMGGDLGPGVVVEGAIDAARTLDLPIALVGNEPELRELVATFNAANDTRITIHHAPEVLTMDDSPSAVIRGKSGASVRVAFELVRSGKASAVVSTGNTGGMMAAGLFVLGTLPGIVRPAIASVIPRAKGDLKPAVLLDSGANIECHAYQLVQFALMGSQYASSVLGMGSPRVGLLSNGSESSKGTDAIRAAGQQLGEMEGIRFTGYVEGRDVARDVVDVVVCDGFVGNVLLKTMEGAVELVIESIRHEVATSTRGKVGMFLIRPLLRRLFKEKLDPSAYGGAPLLGLNGIGIVCHGSSNARAIFNAVRVARRLVDEELVEKLRGSLAALELGTQAGYEDGMQRMGDRFSRSPRGARANGRNDSKE